MNRAVVRFFAIASLASAPLCADTVLWYRLDGFASGVKTDGTTRIDNIASPGNNQLVCHSWTTSRGTDPNWMPVGTAGVGQSLYIYDPVDGTFHERNPNALHVGLTSVASDVADGYGGFLRLLNGIALTNITVEAIFRLAPGDYSSWSWAPVVMQEGSGAMNEGWVISAAGYTKKLCTRFRICDQDGGNAVSKEFRSSDNLTPGKWHHAAFTFDASGTATLYLDYQQVNQVAYSGKKLVAFTSAMTIGANNGMKKRTFPGDVFEVRVSDTAMPPSRFLRMRMKPSVTYDADTVLRTRFLPDNIEPCVDQNLIGDSGIMAFVDTVPGAPDCTFDAQTVPAASFREGIGTAISEDNEGSLHTPTNAAGSGTCLSIIDKDASLFAGDVTLEFFFKTPGTVLDEGDNSSWTLFNSPALRLQIRDADGRLLAKMYREHYVDSTSEYVLGDGRVDDGQWHHVAFVYDAAASNAMLYVDYALKGTISDIDPVSGPSYDITWLGRQDSSYSSGNLQYFPGWVDEVRVTRKVLRPYGFLTSSAVPSVSPYLKLLAHASFDGDYSVSPYPYLSPAGTGVAREGGNEPSFCSVNPGNIALDGEAADSLLINRGSVRMDGSQVRFPRIVSAERDSYTVECFAKITSADAGVGFLRHNAHPDRFEGGSNPRWMLYLNNNKDNVLVCRLQTPGWSAVEFNPMPSRFADGKWHHYALTFDLREVDGEPTTFVELWRDYVSLGVRSAKGTLLLTPSECAFAIGANQNFSGYVDELRFTDGVLPVSAFMRAMPKGMVLTVR